MELVTLALCCDALALLFQVSVSLELQALRSLNPKPNPHGSLPLLLRSPSPGLVWIPKVHSEQSQYPAVIKFLHFMKGNSRCLVNVLVVFKYFSILNINTQHLSNTLHLPGVQLPCTTFLKTLLTFMPKFDFEVFKGQTLSNSNLFFRGRTICLTPK